MPVALGLVIDLASSELQDAASTPQFRPTTISIQGSNYLPAERSRICFFVPFSDHEDDMLLANASAPFFDAQNTSVCFPSLYFLITSGTCRSSVLSNKNILFCAGYAKCKRDCK